MAVERRQHKRVSATFPCVLVGADHREEPFDLMDLSESGVRLRCHHAIAPMTQIRVALRLPGERVGQPADVKLETRGVVVWSHKQAAAKAGAAKAGAAKTSAAKAGKATAESYDTGVFFPELSRDQRALLLAYVLTASA